MGGMKQWTSAETTELIVKSWLWMTLITAPVATVIAVAWWNPIALSLFVPASLIFTGIGAAIGGIASAAAGIAAAIARWRLDRTRMTAEPTPADAVEDAGA